MTRLDWRSAGLACTADADWRSRIWHGGLLLLLPFVGWPLVLGYRRLFVERLLDGARPLLPAWQGNHGIALRHGLAAMAVIHAWYAPLYLWLAIKTTEAHAWQELPWLPALVFVASFSIFSTLIVPVWLLWFRFGCTVSPAPIELGLIGVPFALATFLIPAGFLNVSRTRRTISAFDVRAALRLVRAAPAAYVEAWMGSGILSLAAHFCLPLAPWAVTWCYLAIVYAFNDVPRRSGHDLHRRSWFDYFEHDHWKRYRIERRALFEELRLRPGHAPPTGDADRGFCALRVGPLCLLLPSPRPS